MDTSAATSAAYLLVLGLGLGMTMQVLVLAVQNAVEYAVLGAATSGVTMLRGIGGSLGTALFGSIFANRLAEELGRAPLPGAVREVVASGGRVSGEQLSGLSAGALNAYKSAYVEALTPVFLVAAFVLLAGFAVAWLLEERPLRATAAATRGLEDSLAAPKEADSLRELERAIALATPREARMAFHRDVARRAGAELSPGATWALVRIDEHGFAGARTLAEAQGVPPRAGRRGARRAARLRLPRGRGRRAGHHGRRAGGDGAGRRRAQGRAVRPAGGRPRRAGAGGRRAAPAPLAGAGRGAAVGAPAHGRRAAA